MLDTRENAKETIKEIQDFFDSIEVDEKEYTDVDLSYLDD